MRATYGNLLPGESAEDSQNERDSGVEMSTRDASRNPNTKSSPDTPGYVDVGVAL